MCISDLAALLPSGKQKKIPQRVVSNNYSLGWRRERKGNEKWARVPSIQLLGFIILLIAPRRQLICFRKRSAGKRISPRACLINWAADKESVINTNFAAPPFSSTLCRDSFNSIGFISPHQVTNCSPHYDEKLCWWRYGAFANIWIKFIVSILQAQKH